MSSEPPAASGTDRSDYLPDFCEPQAVLTVVLVSALLAIVVALAQYGARDDFLLALARTSGYLLWNGLLCALVLCKSRPWLARHSLRASTIVALGLVVLTVALVSEATYRLGRAWEGELGVPSGIFPREHWKFLLPNVGIAAIVGALALRYFHVAHQWQRNIELETRARIRALQARIRPHFPVQQHERHRGADAHGSGTRRGGDRGPLRPVPVQPRRRAWSDPAARRARGRAGLSAHRAAATGRSAAGELADRATCRRHALVPSLLLQPLLENAIGHGIESRPAGGTVTVQARVDGATIEIGVSNPMSPDRRLGIERSPVALDNIRQRLELAYPGRSSVTVDDSGDDYRVTLKFPLVLGAAPAPVRPADATG